MLLALCRRNLGRGYASVSSGVLPSRQSTEHIPPSELDDFLLASLSSTSATGPTLRDLINQYDEHSGSVLASSLPYESRPTGHRRPTFDTGNAVVMVAHCAQDRLTGKHKVTVSSGFALAGGGPNEGGMILTCAHTLAEARTRHSFERSAG